MIRFEEIRQSARIVEQALDQLPAGPFKSDHPLVVMPDKAQTYGNIEGMVNHFKLIMHGIMAPVGEVYDWTESPNGELGFYVVSDGTMRPYKCKVRPPCFSIYSSLPRLVEGGLVADAIAVLSSLNIVAGELDLSDGRKERRKNRRNDRGDAVSDAARGGEPLMQLFSLPTRTSAAEPAIESMGYPAVFPPEALVELERIQSAIRGSGLQLPALWLPRSISLDRKEVIETVSGCATFPMSTAYASIRCITARRRGSTMQLCTNISASFGIGAS
jgi:hypothetical protein